MTDQTKKSVLTDLQDLVLNITDFEQTKKDLIAAVKSSTMRAQDITKFVQQVMRCSTTVDLQRYFYNSLLKFEGQGTIGLLKR